MKGEVGEERGAAKTAKRGIGYADKREIFSNTTIQKVSRYLTLTSAYI
jgi:hypothetical protein